MYSAMGAYKASKLCGLIGHVLAALRRMRGAALPRRGYIPVSVGAENDETTKRYMVQTSALCDADFLELLSQTAEEYGFRNQGIIRIHCESKVFEERMLLKGTKLKEC